MDGAAYRYGDRYLPDGIQTIEAEYFVQITKENKKHVEGLFFDKNRDLYFTEINDCCVSRVDMKTGTISRILKDQEIAPVAVKIRKDGTIFVCSARKRGGIFTMKPDGTDICWILPGWYVDDLVFDAQGGFYFTHFVGDVTDPCGGVYYMPADGKRVQPVIEHLAAPNGVALSTDGKILWVTETGRGNLIRIELADFGHNSLVYHFTGYMGPDSCSIDEDDNLYVAVVGQGKVMVFNPYGHPFAQILLPGAREGYHSRSSHPMVHPDRKEVYITAADDYHDKGSWIFRAPAFACGNPEYRFG